MSEEKIGIKTDCVFYKDNKHCTALNEMYCHKEICNFYDNGEGQQILRMSADEFEKAKAEAVKSFAKRLCEGRVSNDPVAIAVQVELKEVTYEDSN